jgi:hypothetical protein
MQQAFHVFGYLKKHARSRMVFDKMVPAIDQSRFRVVDWSDSDHFWHRLTRQSHTGVLIFVNTAPILWHSKRQNTVESSTFGSEFVDCGWQWT